MEEEEEDREAIQGYLEPSDVILVVWDILSHMVSISVGHCLAKCTRVDWTNPKVQQGTHLQIHADHWPN